MTYSFQLVVSMVPFRPLLLPLLLTSPGQSLAFLGVRPKPSPVFSTDRALVEQSPSKHPPATVDPRARDRPSAPATLQRHNPCVGRQYTTTTVALSAESNGGSEMGDDHRELVQQLHMTMPSDGKEERLQQPSRDAHNRRQAAVFDATVDFFASGGATPPQVIPSLRRIAEACRLNDGDDRGGSSRVVDVGCGTGALVHFLKEAGVSEKNVIGVDLSAKVTSIFAKRFPEAEVVNADFVDFADALVAARKKAPIAATRTGKDGEGAPSDESGVERAEENTATKAVGVVAFNAMFGNLWNQGIALERAVDILEELGKVVISHPLGRGFVRQLKHVDSTVVPHELPDEKTLQQLVQIESFQSSKELYLAVLRRTPHRACETVRYLRGKVSRGYGRGSKKLGVATANLPESQFAENLRSLPAGVYFGWASLERGESTTDADEGPWKCVANVGYSPTFAGQENPEKIVEGHLISYRGGDFYDITMRMVLVGFQRFERKFASFPELVATINKDVRDAEAALVEPRFATFKADEFFSLPPSALGSWSTREFEPAMAGADGDRTTKQFAVL